MSTLKYATKVSLQILVSTSHTENCVTLSFEIIVKWIRHRRPTTRDIHVWILVLGCLLWSLVTLHLLPIVIPLLSYQSRNYWQLFF